MPILLAFYFLTLTFCSTAPDKPTGEETSQNIDRKAIRSTIFSHKKYISDCYGRTLVKPGNEHLKGTVMVNFNIAADGKAKNTKVLQDRSSLQNAQLNQCLIEGLKTWDFPVHKEGLDVSVNYPFVFQEHPPQNMQKKMDRFEKMKRSKPNN